MVGRERGQLIAPSAEEWIGGDEQRPRRSLRQHREGPVDFPLAASLENFDLLPERARRRGYVSQRDLGIGVIWIHENPDYCSCRYKLAEQLQPFRLKRGGDETHACN